MAWRIHDLVVEGEIDNTTKGLVRGWLQFSDRPNRVTLFLKGGCHPDLAGWRFRITRRRPVPEWAEPADSTDLAMEQVGHAGDITADQTIKDSDCPTDELLARIRAGEPPPHIMRKALYLEWYSDRNGRVVIQDTRLGVERIGERAFELTEEDLARKREEAEQAVEEFAAQGVTVESTTIEFPSQWPSDEEIEETFGPGALAVDYDPQGGNAQRALQALPEIDLSHLVDPFPGLEIEDEIPGLPPPRKRCRKIRELVDPPLTPPTASQLTQQRAQVELRKLALLLLPWNIHIQVCPHFDPKFALEWAEYSVLWANVPDSLADEEPAPPIIFRSADNCEHCREELGEQWRAPS